MTYHTFFTVLLRSSG